MKNMQGPPCVSWYGAGRNKDSIRILLAKFVIFTTDLQHQLPAVRLNTTAKPVLPDRFWPFKANCGASGNAPSGMGDDLASCTFPALSILLCILHYIFFYFWN